MTDPTTSNKLLAIPTRGSDSGTWDLPVNGNSNALDGILGGVQTLAFTSASTVLLTVPSTGTVVAGAGPNQSENALLRFTGTLTGNIIVQFTLPGYYIIDNLCTVGATYFVQLQPAAGTASAKAIGAPPGRLAHVFYDGTDMKYCNMPEVGAMMDLCVSTTPAWMTACSVRPYLICDGTVYTTSNFTSLGNLLGSAFGGNGITTFGVPDLRARYRIPLDNQGGTAANRITSPVSGIVGTSIGSFGGDQNMPAHLHTSTITDPGHVHTWTQQFVGGASGGGVSVAEPAGTFTSNSATTNIAVAVNTSGTGTGANIPPGLVFGMTFIKT